MSTAQRTLHPRLQALQDSFAASPLTEVFSPALSQRQLRLWLKRDDLLHPIISGNKWRKLKYVLDHALQSGAHTLVSMGGPYSNHLHALAYAGQVLGLNTVAYVRGESPEPLTPTLQDAQAWGMRLRFTSRSDYRLLRAYKDPASLPGLQAGEYWVPEGGACERALPGVAELVAEVEADMDAPFDVLAVACGTGTTLAGLVLGAPSHTQVIGVAALKNADFLQADVQSLLASHAAQARADWRLVSDETGAGFGKTSPALLSFMHDFEQAHGIALDPVYTGKLMFAIDRWD